MANKSIGHHNADVPGNKRYSLFSNFLPPLLYRYVIKELVIPFAVILFIFTGLLFLARSLKLVELIVNKTASLSDILVLFSYVIPQFLELAIPMAFLLSIIIAFGRLSADSELVVMRSVGLSLSKLVLPVLIFSIIVTILSSIVSLSIRPWANYQLGLGLFRLASAQASSGIIAGSFNEIGPLTIYAREVLREGDPLKDVIISDRRSPESQRIFFAGQARIRSNEELRAIQIQLYDGSMHEGTGTNLSQTQYSSNSITISETELSESNETFRRKKTGEMGTYELKNEIHNRKKLSDNDIIEIVEKESDQDTSETLEQRVEHWKHHTARLRVELQKRLVLPASCLCVSLLALALGIQPSRGGSRWGMTLSFITGIFFILAYYISFAIVSAISETKKSGIEILMWGPNITFFLLGVILFRQVGTEKWTAVTDTIVTSVQSISFRLGQLRKVRDQE
ncbi:MAG TPA: LptF/LptG family permease [Oligoflexia bacterium]|mgnify:CR=1 FL=1|nr:LptF/LptG family permease [Oligoflexia bacterium]HMP47601.1 LptF/LptG family permease [Oligoflexia bacterium]